MDELAFYKSVALAGLGQDPAALLEGVLAAAVELTGAARGALVLAEAGGEPRLQARHGSEAGEPGVSRSVLQRVLAGGCSVRLENALDEPDYAGQPSVRGLPLLSVLAVPFAVEGRTLGALYLDSSRVSAIFTPEHQALIERFATHLGPHLARLAATLRLTERVDRLERDLRGGDRRLLGESPRLLALRDGIRRVGPSEVPVLVLGESGSGKELVAEALHAASPRRGGPFVALNCGALPGELLESELFGHRPGAFTGAREGRRGRFAAADGGTLFLDEIGELPAPAQAALLRVLESGELQVVGADRPSRVSVRVVAATNRDLAAEAEAGRFRADLFYRLSVVTLDVPPLRAREDDLLLLAAHFLRRFARAEGRPSARLSPATHAALRAHPWPGNVRELQNAIHRALLFAPGESIEPEHLPAAVRSSSAATPPAPERAQPRTKAELDAAKAAAADALEREFVLEALRRTEGNVSRAARETGLHRSVIHRILKRMQD